MMSGIDIAAIILASGYVAGGALDRVKRLAKDRREERQLKINGPEPVCGCGHHLAYHDLRDLRCYAEVKREKAELAADGTKKDVWQQCECRRYAGPEPLATFYAPPIARAVSAERAEYAERGEHSERGELTDQIGPGSEQ